jgi:hypothetical protein
MSTMENSSAGDLEKLYAAMSDEEFVSIRKTDLTDVARECYDREAARRGPFAGIIPTAPGKPRRIGGGFSGMRLALWIWFWILACEGVRTFQNLAGIWDWVNYMLILGPLLAIHSGWIVVSDRPTENVEARKRIYPPCVRQLLAKHAPKWCNWGYDRIAE